MYTLLQIREALEHSWGPDTTYCQGAYSTRNPSCGQCLVSSLVIQKFLGGELVGARFKEPYGESGSHYWLRINGVDVDFTWQQFKTGTRITHKRAVSRDKMLAHRSVNLRYGALLYKVEQYLKTGKIAKTASLEGVVPDHIKNTKK